MQIHKISRPIILDWLISQHERIMEWTGRAFHLEVGVLLFFFPDSLFVVTYAFSNEVLKMKNVITLYYMLCYHHVSNIY